METEILNELKEIQKLLQIIVNKQDQKKEELQQEIDEAEITISINDQNINELDKSKYIDDLKRICRNLRIENQKLKSQLHSIALFYCDENN